MICVEKWLIVVVVGDFEKLDDFWYYMIKVGMIFVGVVF